MLQGMVMLEQQQPMHARWLRAPPYRPGAGCSGALRGSCHRWPCCTRTSLKNPNTFQAARQQPTLVSSSCCCTVQANT
jgi:hypothetical protein